MCGHDFVLVGVVARISDHFTAYVRTATGAWELFNGLSTHVSKATGDTQVSPTLLAFIKL